MTQDYQRHGGAFKTEAAAKEFIDRLKRGSIQSNSYEIASWEALENVPSVSTFVPQGGVVVIVEAKADEIPQIQALVMECMGRNLLEEQLNSWEIQTGQELR